MKRETFLTIAIVALLLLNLGTLGYLTLSRERHDGPMPPPPLIGERGRPGDQREVDHLIVSSLRLTREQESKFDSLKRLHHEAIMKLDGEYETKLTNYFDLLQTGRMNTTAKDSLERQLSLIQKEKASITFDHFRDLRSLCTPEQQPAFDSLLPHLTSIIAPRQEFPPPPRRN